jgi:hypothetical protein
VRSRLRSVKTRNPIPLSPRVLQSRSCRALHGNHLKCSLAPAGKELELHLPRSLSNLAMERLSRR